MFSWDKSHRFITFPFEIARFCAKREDSKVVQQPLQIESPPSTTASGFFVCSPLLVLISKQTFFAPFGLHTGILVLDRKCKKSGIGNYFSSFPHKQNEAKRQVFPFFFLSGSPIKVSPRRMVEHPVFLEKAHAIELHLHEVKVALALQPPPLVSPNKVCFLGYSQQPPREGGGRTFTM